MTLRRRYLRTLILFTATVLAVVITSGCKPGPTTIVGSVSFRNNPPKEFPPAIHPGTVDGDVCYVRLVDNDGAGPTILWQSPAYPMTFLGTYTYDPADPLNQTPTTADGVYIESFVITLTEAQIAAATMPLRLEAYMYDTAVGVVDPVADAPNRYSYYNLAGDGEPGWRISITIGANEIKTVHLYTTVDFP